MSTVIDSWPHAAIPTHMVDGSGITRYSRWVRRSTGAQLIVIARTESPKEGLCSSLTVLDVNNEHAIEVHPDDWLRWIKEQKIARIRKETVIPTKNQ